MAAAQTIQSGPVSVGAQSHRPIFAVGAVLLAAFLANFDTRIYSISLADLRGAMGLSFDEAAWLGTATTASQIFVAPAVAWFATAFGLRRVLGIPALIYGAVAFVTPLTTDYQLLMTINIVRGLLLGTFVPATLLIIFRNLPIKWWLPSIAIYCLRVGFTLNTSIAAAGFYVDDVGWQWLFWQDCLVAPLLTLFVFLGTPKEPIERDVVREADWGGMLLLGAGMAMIYAGLDQGNRLNWTDSGLVAALLAAGLVLSVGFLINETIVRKPWAHANVLFSRNIIVALILIALYSLTSLSNALLVPNFLSSVALLRPEQYGTVFLTYAIPPMIVALPISTFLTRHLDVRNLLLVGFGAFAAAALLGTQLTHDWIAADFRWIIVLQSVGHSFTLISIVVIALSSLDPSRATAFAAYIQVMRLGAAEFGVALMSTWLRIRENFASNILGQSVTTGDSDVNHFIARLAGYFSSHGVGLAKARSASALSRLIHREADTLAYVDGFWLAFAFAVIALATISLLKASPPSPLQRGSLRSRDRLSRSRCSSR